MNDELVSLLAQAKEKICEDYKQSGNLYQLERDILKGFRPLQLAIMNEAIEVGLPEDEKKNANAEEN